jgi:hypothetical protein
MFCLLILVSLIANYLSNGLPTQMTTNDGEHNLIVQNQVTQLAALLNRSVSVGAVGAVLSEPISLGSAGVAPFASPNPATIGPGVLGDSANLVFKLGGPTVYDPPGGWTPGGNLGTSGCSWAPPASQNPSVVNCNGGVDLTQNFTNGSHTIDTTGGANLTINDTSSYSDVNISTKGGFTGNVTIVGSHDPIEIDYKGGASVWVTIVGDNDTITMSGTGGGAIYVTIVGNHDTLSWSANGGSTLVEDAWGSNDTTSTSSGGASVYYTGFNDDSPTSGSCPYGNLSGSDSVSGSGGGVVNYNNTVYGGASSSGGWTETWSKTSGQACPFYQTVTVSFKNSALASGSFVVHLQNSYGPAADVAYDSGAVVYAQAGGNPTLVDGPSLSYVAGKATLFLPRFQGALTSEAGVGTVDLAFRLLSINTISIPTGGFVLMPLPWAVPPGTVQFNITTPYAAAWMAYFTSLPGFAGHVSCSGPAAACSGPFYFNGPTGTVTLSLAATSLVVEVAVFSVTQT